MNILAGLTIAAQAVLRAAQSLMAAAAELERLKAELEAHPQVDGSASDAAAQTIQDAIDAALKLHEG